MCKYCDSKRIRKAVGKGGGAIYPYLVALYEDTEYGDLYGITGDGIEVSDSDYWNDGKRLFNYCPICGRQLYRRELYIPIE